MAKLKSYQHEHKGAIIEPSIYFGFAWYHSDYMDADWTGDGWITSGQGHCSTIEECKGEINEMIEEYEEA